MRTTILILMAVALLLSGCSTSDVPADDTDTTAPTDASDDTDEPETPPVPPSDDVRGAFEDYFSSRTDVSWKVTYEMTTDGPGSEMLEGMTMTQYIDGIDRFRTDSSVEGIESRTYVMENTVTVCSKQDEWMCFEADLGESIAAQADVEDDVESGDYSVASSGTRTIAGVSAECFEFTTSEDTEAEYCFSAEGVPLFMRIASAEYTTEMVATDYSTDVPASTWELPAEAGSFPGMDDLPGGFDPSAYT